MAGLLSLIEGVWGDVTGSTYEVYDSGSGESLDVTTTRANGLTKTTKGLIRLDKDDLIVWGTGPSFVLDTPPSRKSFEPPAQLSWRPVGRSSKWFVWTRDEVSRDLASRVRGRECRDARESPPPKRKRVDLAGLAKRIGLTSLKGKRSRSPCLIGDSLQRRAKSRRSIKDDHQYRSYSRDAAEYDKRSPSPPVTPQQDSPRRARPVQTMVKESRDSSRTISSESKPMQRSCVNVIEQHLKRLPRARGTTAASHAESPAKKPRRGELSAAAQPPDVDNSLQEPLPRRSASEKPRQCSQPEKLGVRMTFRGVPSAENMEAGDTNSGKTPPTPDNFDPYYVVPGGDSWDWPLSRVEKLQRVHMLDDSLMTMDSTRAREEFSRLKSTIEVLEDQIMDSYFQ